MTHQNLGDASIGLGELGEGADAVRFFNAADENVSVRYQNASARELTIHENPYGEALYASCPREIHLSHDVEVRGREN
jgi:hypothetical protein